MHLSMHYVKFLISAFIPVRVHGGFFPECLVWVASSSPVGGSGTLQSGIRAHVAAWACMDHQDAVTKAGFPSAQQRLVIMIENFVEKFL